MDTVIPNGVDPSSALNKVMSHYTCLNNMDCEIPKKIILMMFLAMLNWSDLQRSV